MKKRALAISMAAVTALTSTSICAFAEGQDSKALAAAITTAKTRLDIPEELTEFTYYVSDDAVSNVYELNWHTPNTVNEYRHVSVRVCGSLILSYYDSDDGWGGDRKAALAKLTGDELYKKAQEQLKKVDPTIAGAISIDRDSLNIGTYNRRAQFSFVRTKNGVPVKNDRGSIVIDKDTGSLISLSLSWHEKAAFQDSKNAISADKAKDKYEKMIKLEPQYEFEYDWQTKELTPKLVYRQSDYGVINAFTGKKSNFQEDAYYDDDMANEETAADTGGKGGDGGYNFTEQEQAELDKKLPYANKDAVIKLLTENKYLSYQTDMELTGSDLYKISFGGKDRYYYGATFSNEKWDDDYIPIEEPVSDVVEDDVVEEEVADGARVVSINVDAESGQIISYHYYDSKDMNSEVDSYDLSAADKIAKAIAEEFCGDKLGEYQDYTSNGDNWTDGQKNTHWNGSNHNWTRYANGIKVSGDYINVYLGADMKLRNYIFEYTDVELPKPDGMLTAEQVMDKFWENNSLDMYYLARVSDKKTKTVLVYGTDNSVYADAFTGEPVYTWEYQEQKNDLSGIKDKKVLKMAEALDDHGFFISAEKFSDKDPAKASDFENLVGMSTDMDQDKELTKGDALVIYVKSMCGEQIPELKGIYKSPFTDVSDSDENIGYYAIAYGLGLVSGSELGADKDFTYGDMIRMIYTRYTQG